MPFNIINRLKECFERMSVICSNLCTEGRGPYAKPPDDMGDPTNEQHTHDTIALGDLGVPGGPGCLDNNEVTSECKNDRQDDHITSSPKKATQENIVNPDGPLQPIEVNDGSENEAESEEDDSEEELCCICLEDLQSGPQMQLECLHTVHTSCGVIWIKKKNQCPMCRGDATKDVKLPRKPKTPPSPPRIVEKIVYRERIVERPVMFPVARSYSSGYGSGRSAYRSRLGPDNY